MENKTAPLFIAACIGMCFFGVSMIVLGAILPLLCENLSLSQENMSSLTIILPVSLLGGSVVFGPIVDRFGHKLLLIGNCVLVMIGVLLLAMAADMAMLRVAMVAIGFGGGVLNGETNALVTDIYTGSKRNSRLSLLGTFYGLGALALPVLLGALSGVHYTTILYGLAAVMAIGIAVCIPVKFPAPKQPQGFPLRDAAKVVTHPLMWLCAFILFFQSGTEGVTNNWTATYLTESGFNYAESQMSLTAMLIGLTAARIVLSWLLTRVSHVAVLSGSLIIAGAGYLLLYSSTEAWLVYTAMAMVGAGLASTFPVVLGQLGERFTSLSGTAISLALVVALSGQTTLNYIQGEAGATSMPMLLIIAVCAMLVLWIASVAVQKQRYITNSQSH